MPYSNTGKHFVRIRFKTTSSLANRPPYWIFQQWNKYNWLNMRGQYENMNGPTFYTLYCVIWGLRFKIAYKTWVWRFLRWCTSPEPPPSAAAASRWSPKLKSIRWIIDRRRSRLYTAASKVALLDLMHSVIINYGHFVQSHQRIFGSFTWLLL